MNNQTKTEFKNIPVRYPTVDKDTSVVENYHGNTIADPYRWLEDDNSEQTTEWVKAQNQVTFNYLEKIPFREAIKDRLTELWNYEKSYTPFKKGEYYYYFKNDGLQNQNVLYRMTSLGGEEKLVLDPNKFSDDGTASLAGFGISDDSKYMAYQVSEGGSDWRKIYVMDLETGNKLDDKIEWVKFSGVSMKDHGFYYSRYPEPKAGTELDAKNEYHQIWYHKIGTAQLEDVMVFDNPKHPQRNSYGQTTEDESYLVTYTSESTSGNELRVKDITSTGNPMIQLTEGFDSDYSVIDSDGSKLYVMTNNDAGNWKLMAVNVSNPANPKWSTIIPEAKEVLSGKEVS
jgi:prolyl oligopeptidase